MDQDVVIALFQAIQKRFNLPFAAARGVAIEIAQQQARAWLQGEANPAPQLQAVNALLDEAERSRLQALLVLAQLGEDSLNALFGGNDSVGSVMRKRLEPLTTPVLQAASQLLN
ncbi:MAG: hypothetical protein R3E95_05345 [Thiolinea sp.]